MIRGITLVNRELRALELPCKVVRGAGYYYVIDTGDASTFAGLYSSSIPVYRLEPSGVAFALDWIAELLTDWHNGYAAEEGKRAEMAARLKARCIALRAAPLAETVPA